MAGYQLYPEYKNSGVEWLGDVPRHWDVSKMKLHFDIQLGKMLQPEPRGIDDEEVTYLKAGHVQWEKIDLHELPTMWASPKEREKFRVNNGDLLVCEGGEVGRSALMVGLEQECIIQNALHRIRPLDHTCTKYLNYLMRHLADADWFSILCNKATIAHLTGDKLGALVFSMPTLEEQQTIARFLDHKTAQIDALIAKKQTLLEKLAEKRTALISHAVTKGLDPNVKMKDSGVEWLGKVPEHWEILPLRRLVQSVKTGGTPAGVNDSHFDDEGLLWFRPGDFLETIYLENAEKRLSAEGITEVRIFPVNTVLHVGIGATIGKVGITMQESSCNQQINAIVCNAKLKPIFAAYYFHLIRDYIVRCGKYTTLPIINQDETKNLIFTVPPIVEQKNICAFLHNWDSRLEKQKNKIEYVIEKLKEYRSALITQAVTGKVDLRNIGVAEIEVELQ